MSVKNVKRDSMATLEQKEDQHRMKLENQFASGKSKTNVAWDAWLQREEKTYVE